MTNNNNAILLVLLINKKVQQKNFSPYARLLVPESSYLVDM